MNCAFYFDLFRTYENAFLVHLFGDPDNYAEAVFVPLTNEFHLPSSDGMGDLVFFPRKKSVPLLGAIEAVSFM